MHPCHTCTFATILKPHGRLAQRLAQVLYTHKAGGSNPSSPTNGLRRPRQRGRFLFRARCAGFEPMGARSRVNARAFAGTARGPRGPKRGARGASRTRNPTSRGLPHPLTPEVSGFPRASANRPHSSPSPHPRSEWIFPNHVQRPPDLPGIDNISPVEHFTVLECILSASNIPPTSGVTATKPPPLERVFDDKRATARALKRKTARQPLGLPGRAAHEVIARMQFES